MTGAAYDPALGSSGLAGVGHVSLANGGWARVGAPIGSGAEGAVFEAVDGAGETWALKWYRAYSREKHDLIEFLLNTNSPGACFLWPVVGAWVGGNPGFGYLMPLCRPGFVPLNLYANEKVDAEPQAVIRACLLLARSFQRLHARGLCYRDISFGNVLLDPHHGDIRICDNDNVGIDDGTASRVLGTPRFMAPEVLRGNAVPSAGTDLHSLAIALFWLLTLTHPLEGRKTDLGLRGGDLSWEREHYGRDPVFVLDPEQERNRPTEDNLVEDVWSLFPRSLQSLFVQAFTVGLTDPDQRVREYQWAKAMRSLRDGLHLCTACRGVLFAEPGRTEQVCPRCGIAAPPPRWLRTATGHVLVSDRTAIWTDHFGKEPDEAVAIGQFAVHPEDPRRWGLRNLTDREWTATEPDQSRHRIDPGRSVECRPGLRLRFADGEAEVST